MEFFEFLKDKKIEIGNLEQQLSKIESEFENVKEKLPPRWSGDVKELNKFVTDLGEWIKSPKIKRAKDLIDNLKKYGNDNRSFKGLGEDYLISILDILENAITILSEIENKSLKVNASIKILDKLQGEEEDFNDLVQDIRKYWQSFKKFEEKEIQKEIQNEFLDAVKKDLLISLTEPGAFSLERIREGDDTFEKAANAFKLLINFGVNAQAYIKTYETSKSADKIWEEADNVRRLLVNTDFQIARKIENPFGEMLGILNRRNQCIKEKNLSEISSCLKEIKKKIEDWKRDVRKKFDDEYHKTKVLIEFAKLEERVEELLEEFGKKIEESFNANDIYDPYRKLQEIKSKATKELEGQFCENERKIIENLENADKLVESMGEDFWITLKALRKKQLIKIVIERSI